MKIIYKYKLNHTQIARIPKGAEILKLAIQNEYLCLWALVDDQKDIELRTFHIFATGYEIDPSLNLNYIDTFFTEDGLVFHVFEEIK